MDQLSTVQTTPQTSKINKDLLEVKLSQRLGSRIRNLQLIEHVNGWILCGHTNTYYAKQLAQHALLDESSRPLFRNEIVVS